MKRTNSGIDSFEIRWQAFNVIEIPKENYRDIKLIFKAEKPQNQSLTHFFDEYNGYSIFPKYFINNVNLTSWWNENRNLRFDEFDSNEINVLKIAIDSRNYAWLKMLYRQMLGHRVDIDLVKSLCCYKEEYFEGIIEEENEDVQLYGCSCGDRMCGYFPIQVIRSRDFICWRFYDSWRMRTLIFPIEAYEKAFEELMTFVRKEYEKRVVNLEIFQ